MSISLAGGAVQVHLTCSKCCDNAWSHQQIAWLAERIATELAKTAAATDAASSLTPTSSASHPTSAPPGVGTSSDAASQGVTAAKDDTSLLTLPAPLLGKKGPRMRTGCFTCRRKRVKCDEVKPICTRCKRNPDRQCVYPKSSSDPQAGYPSPLSKRGTPAPAASGSVLNMAGAPLALINNPTEPVLLHQPAAQVLPEQHALFMDGLAFISAPGLLNAQPNKREARARSDRVLAKLWEAQMIVSATGQPRSATVTPPVTPQLSFSKALVSAAWSLGALKRAFKGTRPTPLHDEMITRSRIYFQDATSVIRAFNRGEGRDEPETFLVLFGLFLLRDCGCGDPMWANTHTLLTAYIKRKGGVSQMLQADRGPMRQGNSLLDHHLVYLTIYNTFAALSLNLTPYFLSPGDCQWIEDVPCAQQVIHADFGFSLQTLFSVAELATLLAQRPNMTDSQSPSVQQYWLACNGMYEALETFAMATIYSTPAPARVQFGDLLIRHALICHLQCVAFGRRRHDPVVKRSAAAMMELLVEVAIRTGSMVNLNYPMLVVAGLVDKEDQCRLQRVIDFAKVASGLVEIDRMESIVHECWRRTNLGEEEMRMTDVWCPNAPMLIL